MYIPVCYPGLVEMSQSTCNFCCVEDSARFTEPWLSHIVYVEAEISSSHQCQNHTESIFGLVGIHQTHLQAVREVRGDRGQ